MALARDTSTKRDRWVTLIAVAKLFKCVVLLAGGGFVVVVRTGAGVARLHQWIEALSLTPANRLVQRLSSAVSGLDSRTLDELGVGLFVYAALFLVEGAGLLARKRWAEFLTVFITASFVPFEVYEIARHVTVGRVLALALNLAVVAYLAWHLRRTREAKARGRQPPPHVTEPRFPPRGAHAPG